MILIAQLLIGTVMLLAALLHFYWSFGGRKWSDAVIPTKPGEEKAFLPGPIMTFSVALIFLSVAIYFFLLSNIFPLSIPTFFSGWATWVIAGGFILRAMGDFRYFGLFKTIRNTTFAKMDSRYYTPLVLVLGILSLLSAIQTL